MVIDRVAVASLFQWHRQLFANAIKLAIKSDWLKVKFLILNKFVILTLTLGDD